MSDISRTPQEALAFVRANPPLGDLPSGADGTEPGGEPWEVCQLVDIPEVGIEFHPDHTDKYHKYMCWWHNAENKDGHVYEVTVEPCCSVLHGNVSLWRSRAHADGKELFVMETKSKRLAIEMALSAMRRYLMRGHRAALRTWRKAHADHLPTGEESQS